MRGKNGQRLPGSWRGVLRIEHWPTPTLKGGKTEKGPLGWGIAQGERWQKKTGSSVSRATQRSGWTRTVTGMDA